MRILFLSRWFPYPPDNGSRIRIFNLIKHLSARHEVFLLSFASAPPTETQRQAMGRYCQRIADVSYRPFRPTGWKARLGFLSPRPRSVLDTYSAELQQRVERLEREHRFEVVIASQVDMAPYALSVVGPARLLEEVELTTFYEQFVGQPHSLRKMHRGLMWWKWSRYADGLLRAFDGCTVVSQRERELVGRVAPGYRPVAVVPNGMDVAHHAADFGMPQADTLVYAGALTYEANFDAMHFFLRDVFPLIQAERPGVKILITGRLDGVPVHRLPRHPGVVLTDYLDDVRSTVARSWASVAPLRVGGGTRVKILEALALGTPVVSTSKGAEGLDLVPGREMLIADDPADFAAAVLRLLQDRGLREQLSRNGREAVKMKYDWRIIGERFNAFVEAVASKTHPLPEKGKAI